jgi:hypothetical protein
MVGFFWTSYSDNDIVWDMWTLIGSERARRPFYEDWGKDHGREPTSRGRYEGQAARAITGSGSENMRFCETKPNQK